MRDLKRPNAKLPAYKMLTEKSFRVFTPMKIRLVVKAGKRIREQVPFIQDLLFVHSVKEELDNVVDNVETLQYRFVRGAYRQPMVVHEVEMERFIRAVESTDTPVFYLPDELTPDMFGKRIRIVGGPLDGYEGKLLKARGKKAGRLIVELQQLLAVGVEVSPEYVQVLGNND